MNIVYLGSFRLPNVDAAAARVLNVSRALRELGHNVTFISWGGIQREHDLGEDGIYRVDGFPYIVTNELPQVNLSIPERIANKFKRGNITKCILKERSDSIDVIISYNNSLCAWLIPFCKKCKIKLISDITEWYSYNELSPIDLFRYAFEMHCCQKRVKNKIVISRYLDRFYRGTHNIVVPAICDASELKWQSNIEYAKTLVKSFDGITLIYAGNPAKKDLVHLVINAVDHLACEGVKIRFLIIGVTRKNYISRYGSMLHPKELHENIIFLGRMSQDIIPSFYQQADFMVLLREENRKSNAGFPTKFSESFISGTPVIANITSDLGQYLKDGETGFVVDKPIEEAVYETIKGKVMALSQEEIKEMKRNVMEGAKRFDYHTYVESIKKFMNDLN